MSLVERLAAKWLPHITTSWGGPSPAEDAREAQETTRWWLNAIAEELEAAADGDLSKASFYFAADWLRPPPSPTPNSEGTLYRAPTRFVDRVSTALLCRSLAQSHVTADMPRELQVDVKGLEELYRLRDVDGYGQIAPCRLATALLIEGEATGDDAKDAPVREK